MNGVEETQGIMEWRLLCFGLMGYGLDEANELAGSSADLWYVRTLLADGATLDEARRIAL